MRRSLRVVVGVLAGFAFVSLLVLTGSRFVDVLRPLPLAITSLSAYALPGYAVLLVVLLLLARGSARRRVPLAAALVSLVLLLCHLYWVRSYFPADGPASGDLTVVSANLEVGSADTRDVLRAVDDADVAVLQEVTPASLQALEAAGIGEELPYRAGRAVAGVRGTVVLSRYELSGEQALDLQNGGLTVEVAAPTPFRLYAVHTAMLLGSPQRWNTDLLSIRDRLARDVRRGPVLAVGDWNATYSHRPMRQVLDAGVRDAAQEAGTWRPTWPTRWRESWLRPLVAIDHVLMSKEFGAVSTRTVEMRHSDHMAVVATLALRSSPQQAATQ